MFAEYPIISMVYVASIVLAMVGLIITAHTRSLGIFAIFTPIPIFIAIINTVFYLCPIGAIWPLVAIVSVVIISALSFHIINKG